MVRLIVLHSAVDALLTSRISGVVSLSKTEIEGPRWELWKVQLAAFVHHLSAVRLG